MINSQGHVVLTPEQFKRVNKVFLELAELPGGQEVLNADMEGVANPKDCAAGILALASFDVKLVAKKAEEQQ